MIAVSSVSAMITVRSGPRTTLMTGALVVMCAYGFATLMHTQLWQLLVCSALVGAGIGLAYGGNALAHHERGPRQPDRGGQRPEQLTGGDVETLLVLSKQ